MVTLGHEAWLVASRLASISAGVQLEMRLPPHLLDNRFKDDSVLTLTRAGVKVALTVANVDARLLRWEAGWAREYGLTTAEALATVTVNPADMFGMLTTHVIDRAHAELGLIVALCMGHRFTKQCRSFDCGPNS